MSLTAALSPSIRVLYLARASTLALDAVQQKDGDSDGDSDGDTNFVKVGLSADAHVAF